MPLKVWNGSSWLTGSALKVWNGSSWTAAKTGKVWNGSSWITFFSGTTVNITNQTLTASATNYESASAEAQYILLNTGVAQYSRIEDSIQTTDNITGEWLSTGTASDISVKFTVLSWSGNYPNSSTTFGTWTSLSADQYISVWAGAVSSSGTVTQNSYGLIKVDLAFTSDTSTILDTANIEFSVTAQAYV